MNSKTNRFLILLVALLFLAFGRTQAAQVTFSQDTEMNLTGLSESVYATSGSACNSLEVGTSTLKVDVPGGSTFVLATAGYRILGLTPSGGTTTLDFDTSYESSGYVSQWTASSTANPTVDFSVGVSKSDKYLVEVDGSRLGYYNSGSNKIVEFTYSGGFSSKTFTISKVTPKAGSPPPPSPDTSAPSIGDISTSVDTDSATISWITDEGSLSWVVYGTTTDYGEEYKDASYKTSHSVTLGNLLPGTTYHYKIKAEDSSGNVRSSTDKTFTLGEVVGEEEEEEEEEIPRVTFEKPISEMSIEEIKAKINEILEVIDQLKEMLAEIEKPVIEGIPAGFSFETPLQFGMISDDVKYLQIVLNSDPDTRLAETGVGSPGNETNYFGPLTKAAVIKFQEKYKEAVLKPWGFSQGTGYVGRTTKSKLNEILKD